jgi:putative two-component system response regulator
VDVYDALTTNRPYRPALSHAEAFRIIHEETRRGWWDAELVDAFEELLNGFAVLVQGEKLQTLQSQAPLPR